jgi:hypothetical protein
MQFLKEDVHGHVAEFQDLGSEKINEFELIKNSSKFKIRFNRFLKNCNS